MVSARIGVWRGKERCFVVSFDEEDAVSVAVPRTVVEWRTRTRRKFSWKGAELRWWLVGRGHGEGVKVGVGFRGSHVG